jgi:hypothetical protein
MAEDGKRKMPPSLTSEELQAIQAWERTHRSPVVRRLLWEVFRLRAIASLADQFEAMAREIPSVTDGQTIGIIADALRRDLEQLPLIQEKRERDDRILYGHGKTKRKGVNNA